MQLLFVAVALVFAVDASRHYSDVHWHAYKAHYNKSYTDAEEPRRQHLWLQNAQFVKKHNRKVNGHQVALNNIADLTPVEYSRMNGFRRSYGDSLAKHLSVKFTAPLNAIVPYEVDWRDHGFVTPVKNQGMCGSCWAFSSTGALEGQLRRLNSSLVSLSEQNLIDCSTAYGNHGCNGGLMDQAFEYIKENGGISSEVNYPYEGTEGECPYKKEMLGATLAGFVQIPHGDENALKAAVAANGPIAIAIDASHRSFQTRRSCRARGVNLSLGRGCVHCKTHGTNQHG